jgi:hypothetical protein
MNQDRTAVLAELIEQPEIQQKIMGNYEGGYSLGFTSSPESKDELAIRVRIEGEDASVIAPQVTLERKTLPIIVDTQFQPPKPLFVPEADRHRPLVCGIQIANLDHVLRVYHAQENREKLHLIHGTLGCFVRLANGNPALLSNNHVIAGQNRGQPGSDRIVQFGQPPRVSEEDQVAVLADFEEIESSSPDAMPYTGEARLNSMDAAVAQLDDTIPFRQEYLPCRELAVLGKVTAGTLLGSEVSKVGCKTGETHGVIVEIRTIYGPVGYEHGPCWFRRAIVVEGINGSPFAVEGDSGAIIVRRDNGEVVGLLYSGNGSQTYACDINIVLQRFSCTLV